MVQVLPQLPTFGEKLRESLGRAQDLYYAEKEQAQKRQAFQTLSDPNATDQQKSEAILKTGSVADLLKLHKQQQTAANLKKYETLAGARAGVPQGGGTPQVSDQDVGGQANQQPVAEIQPGPDAGSPTAPSQIIKAKKPDVEPQQINDEEVDAAITAIAATDPQIANILQRQEGTRRKTNLANQKAIDHSYELTKDYRSGVTAELESSETSDMLVDRMLELADKQDSTPGFVTLMQKIGVPTAVFGNPNEEEIEKISNELLKNIPTGWRGKILATEFHALMRTVPTLVNSAEGKKLIARNMKLLFSAAPIKYEAMREITKEYLDANKKLPADFEERVLERMKPKMDFLKQEFVKGTDEALSFAERMAQGGTSRYRSPQEEEVRTNPAIQEKLKSLNPVAPGKVRYAWKDGKIFDFTPEEEAIALKKHPNLIRVA